MHRRTDGWMDGRTHPRPHARLHTFKHTPHTQTQTHSHITFKLSSFSRKKQIEKTRSSSLGVVRRVVLGSNQPRLGRSLQSWRTSRRNWNGEASRQPQRKEVGTQSKHLFRRASTWIQGGHNSDPTLFFSRLKEVQPALAADLVDPPGPK